MSKSWFPDIIGPAYVAANGGQQVLLRGKRINFLGAVVSDNATKRRTDVAIDDNSMPAYTYGTGQPSGTEWFPSAAEISSAGLLRLSSASSNVSLVGLGSPDDPTRIVKFITNNGSIPYTVRTPAVITDQCILSAPVTMLPGMTVRATWDRESRVYRIKGAPVAGTNRIVVNGDPIALNADNISNPTA